jgi:hypothetical protein
MELLDGGDGSAGQALPLPDAVGAAYPAVAVCSQRLFLWMHVCNDKCKQPATHASSIHRKHVVRVGCNSEISVRSSSSQSSRVDA